MQYLNHSLLPGFVLACLLAGDGCATSTGTSAANSDEKATVVSINGKSCRTEQAYYTGVAVKAASKHCLEADGVATYLESWKNGLIAARLSNQGYIFKAIRIRREARRNLAKGENSEDPGKSRRLLDNMNKRIRVLQARNEKIDHWLEDPDFEISPSVQTAQIKHVTE